MSAPIARYCNTVKYLRPAQITGQLLKPFILKSKPSDTYYGGLAASCIKTLIPVLDLDEAYLSRFNTEQLMRGEITLLGETHSLDLTSWNVEASPLWRFNLHYFEYAIALAFKYRQTTDPKYYNKFKELLSSWIAANPVGSGDGWHPYTISMRLPNLFICFDLFGSAFEGDSEFYGNALQSIYAQYRLLIKRKELWQLGNHYFENLKTIVLGSLIFAESQVFDKHIPLFLREVDEEILPDGVHFELSVMYHKIILEDILRVACWLRQAGKPQVSELLPVIQKMVNAVASLEKGMGKTPLFNDSADDVSKESSALLLAAKELFDIRPIFSESFDSSGYYKLYDGNIALMFDAGKIGPKYMPGHGHCDCLAFELSVGDRPLFVNAGTYQYQGALRKYFRSTKAHNTVMIGEKEQSECWGEHRVARRISRISAERRGQTITGSYTNYSGDGHTRTISLADSTLRVIDAVNTKESVIVRSFLHLAPGLSAVQRDGSIDIFNNKSAVCEIDTLECKATLHTDDELTNYSAKFGVLQRALALEFSWPSDGRHHGYVVRMKITDGKEYN